MKKILTLLFSFFSIMIGFAQIPNMINYQGVARNSVGNVLPNQAISVKLSIRDLTATGAVVYSEIRNVTTNFYGLFSFGIGSPGATGVTGTIAGVNWAVGAKFLQVEIDPAGGSSFTNVGTTQLLSVPYALFSNAANPTGPAGGDLSGTYPNPTVARIRGVNVLATAPTNRQVLKFNGTDWAPAKDSLILPFLGSDASAASFLIDNTRATGQTSVISAIMKTTTGVSAAISGIDGSSAVISPVENKTYGVIGITGHTGIGVGGYALDGTALRGVSSATGLALHTNGPVRLQGISEGLGKVLTSDASGNATWQALGGGGLGAVFGSGTLNYVPKWTPDGNTLGNSLIFDNGTNIGISTITPSAKLHVYNIGTDAGGFFENINAASSAHALDVRSDGAIASRAIRAFHTGLGVAMEAVISNPANINNAFIALTTGLGRAAIIQSTNPANNSNIIEGFNAGPGWVANLTSNNATPRALRTEGALQFTGIGEALNKVLTSDASGNATWQAFGGGGLGAVLGSGTLNYVPKWTPDGTTLGNSLIFDDGTNVGIGTITPGANLDVIGNARITNPSEQALIIKRTSGTSSNTIAFHNSLDAWIASVGINPTTGELLIDNRQDPAASTTLYPVRLHTGFASLILQHNNGLLFTYGANDRFIIKPDGKVGIGTTTPANKLDIVETGTTNGGIDVQLTNVANSSIGINVTHSGNGKGIRSSTVSGFAVEGTTSSISSGGIIGRNTGGGEAIIGFTTAAGVPAGAVVGRNDGDYAGVHGFSSHANGIGVVARVITAVAGTSTALLATNNQGGALGNIAIFQNNNANVARIDRTGKGFFNNGTQVGGADIAEYFDVEGSRISYEPGDILVISQSSDRKVEKSSTPYSTLVAGVVATKPGVSLTEENAEQNKLDAMVPMGVIGVIPTKVCTEGGAIKRGDMLVTSSIVGVAMKADPEKVKVGQVLGKALQDFDATTVGLIKVLVSVK